MKRLFPLLAFFISLQLFAQEDAWIYFKDKPNIIRKSRNSVAVLTGNETENDFENF